MRSDAQVIALQRLEGAAFAALAIWLFNGTSWSWWLFAVLLLAPDLSMLGYFVGPRIGAIVYNVVHTWAAPLVLFAIGWVAGPPMLLPLAFIWAAHIGIDRALGFGLKLPTGFHDTHLGRLGRSRRP